MVDRMRESLREIAESLSESADKREPNVRSKTGTMPKMRGKPLNSETGSLPAIEMSAEGSEKADQHEGKPLPSDETQPANPEVQAKLALMAKERAEKPTILILEDTEELAEVIQATLENQGMQVDWVSHGSKGIEKIKARIPDVLLLDIGLPDMTGWKVLEELREWKKNPDDLPTVVVITAYGDPANRLIGKLQGIHSYLIKPFTSDEVEKVVQGALRV